MDLRWRDDLSVGNAVIDSGHKNLLNMANEVLRAIQSEDCPAFTQAFDRFEDTLRTHFVSEEDIARTVNFPYARHKREEEYFLRELQLLKQELLSRKCECCAEAIQHYSDTLRVLLMDHICANDMLMKPFLQNYPYDLNHAESRGRYGVDANPVSGERAFGTVFEMSAKH